MSNNVRQTLSPFTISVGGETFDVPTYAISKEEAEELLTMAEGEEQMTEDGFIQRGTGMHAERWFVFNGQEWFSLRLVY